MIDREEVKDLARAQAWDERVKCNACEGDGSVPGGRMLVHSRSKSGFGADWALESVLAFIDRADEIEWRRSIFGTQLWVRAGDDQYSFDLEPPERVA